MIYCDNRLFHLQTQRSSYLFRVTGYGHLEHVFYGQKLTQQSVDSLLMKHTAAYGSSVMYGTDPLTENQASEADIDMSASDYCLDTLTLEWSGIGKGDYRHAPVEILMPDGTFVSDFTFEDYQTESGSYITTADKLPLAKGDDQACQTLIINMKDIHAHVSLQLIYTVFFTTDVITRRVILTNKHTLDLEIRKCMSFMLDIPDRAFQMTSLHGGWIREANRQKTDLPYALIALESTTGASSNRQNPAFLLSEKDATENSGHVYGFNLVYSGNHQSVVQKSEQDLVRIMGGINPHCFSWTLKQGNSFATPEAVLTFSDQGIGGMRENFHKFVNQHIIPPYWQGRERPVLINSWEAFMFDFNQRRLLKLAKKAANLGVELFVLDDGWFGTRDHDKAGLGDYHVNNKKFPHGLQAFSAKLKQMGLDFGLWLEPEMVNLDSDLFREHPEYAVSIPGRQPSFGRHQLVLDLTNAQVRDYIVDHICDLLDNTDIRYVKWDMNRHISDMYSPQLANQGEFFHRYILGLYDILKRIFQPRPHILLESCSSGGNRFDLGMLCFSPQIWASDSTDPIERLDIQGGLSLFYPLSTMGAHVSASPSQQTLRQTSLATRFNAACFGCLGYELNLDHVSKQDLQEIERQISFYKQHRQLFQFGTFYQLQTPGKDQIHWQLVSADRQKAVAGVFQRLARAAAGFDRIMPKGLDPDVIYQVKTFERALRIKRFGGLVNHISPVRLHPDGSAIRLADRFYRLPGCVESYAADGSQLMAGIMLNNAFNGTGYSEHIRMMGDFDSDLYIITSQHLTEDQDLAHP